MGRVMKLVVVLLSMVLVLGAGAAGYRLGSARNRNAGAQLSCPDAPAESLVATLKARVAFLEARLALVAVRADSSARPPVALAPPSGATQEDGAQSGAAAQSADHLATLEALVMKEAPDPVWSPATEQRIRDAGSSLKPPVSLHSVRCGQQFCRIEVRHDRDRRSRQQVGRWLERTTSDVSGQLVIEEKPSGDGTVIVLARPDAELPAATGGRE